MNPEAGDRVQVKFTKDGSAHQGKERSGLSLWVAQQVTTYVGGGSFLWWGERKGEIRASEQGEDGWQLQTLAALPRVGFACASPPELLCRVTAQVPKDCPGPGGFSLHWGFAFTQAQHPTLSPGLALGRKETPAGVVVQPLLTGGWVGSGSLRGAMIIGWSLCRAWCPPRCCCTADSSLTVLGRCSAIAGGLWRAEGRRPELQLLRCHHQVHCPRERSGLAREASVLGNPFLPAGLQR